MTDKNQADGTPVSDKTKTPIEDIAPKATSRSDEENVKGGTPRGSHPGPNKPGQPNRPKH